MQPLLATAALYVRVPWECASLKCFIEPAMTPFSLDARDPLGAVGCVTVPEPFPMGRLDPEPRDTWQRRSPS
jgi:hypothetical protein